MGSIFLVKREFYWYRINQTKQKKTLKYIQSIVFIYQKLILNAYTIIQHFNRYIKLLKCIAHTSFTFLFFHSIVNHAFQSVPFYCILSLMGAYE